MQEQRRAKTEHSKFEENARTAHESLQRHMLLEADELKQMQNAKKQMLVGMLTLCPTLNRFVRLLLVMPFRNLINGLNPGISE